MACRLSDLVAGVDVADLVWPIAAATERAGSNSRYRCSAMAC